MGGCGAKQKQQTIQYDKSRRRLSTGNINERVEDKEDTAGRQKAVVSSLNEILEMFPNSERKLSLQGQNDPSQRREYSDKKLAAHGDESLITENGIGFCCKKGLKPESPNQDDFVILHCGDEFGFFGVMDGHGECGHDISSFVTKTLPGHFVRNKQFAENPKEALKQSFLDTHKAIIRCNAQNQLSATMSGTTCTVAYRKHNKLYCAHTGDSRAIMGVGTDWKKLKAIELTPDHKCELPGEKARIEKQNGVVRRRQGDVPHRVFMKGSYLPGLAMSRSLGDLLAHQVGVSDVPDVREDDLGKETQLLLVCSDGVWEFISNERAIEIMTGKYGPNEIQEACEVLAAEAWKEWKANEYDVVDDITVIGIALCKMNLAPPP